MAQANLAREPSMEEILASIRKIIESNDPADAGSPGPPEETDGATDAVPADLPERPLSLLNRVSVETEDVADPVSLEPAQIEGQAEPDRPEPLAPMRPGLDPPVVNDPSPEDDQPAEAAPVDDGADAPVSLADVAADTRTAVSHEDSEPDNDLVVPPTAEDQIEQESTDEAGDPNTADVQNDSGTSDQRALISPAAGARVAASFDHLSQAVSSGPSRSFDEIAEDMLRPMLQQWMDDNLPTLVERLVREEIERVARGR